MKLFFRTLARCFVLAVAYVFACTLAMATLIVAIWIWQVNYIDFASQTPEEEIFNFVAYSTLGAFAYFSLLSSAFIPALVLGLVTEGLAWRSIFIHVPGGGALSLYILIMSNSPQNIPPQQDIVVTLAAGFIAGLTYWLIAGRSAGNWRVRLKPADG